MSKCLVHRDLTKTLSLSECTNGLWLYDKTRGMNLAMQAKSPEDAFVMALTYYQNRLAKVESELGELRQKVDAFVSQFTDEGE